MDKVNTAAWEEIKHKQNYCLCYSETKGLYVANNFFVSEENVLFPPHGHKGFWRKQVQLPKENLTIRIETNFGYGRRMYMRAIVERDGQRLLDFDKFKLYILNNCSVMTLDVIPYDWKNLFYKIISISKGFSSSQSSSSALSYIEEIDNILNKKEILIKESFDRKNATVWNDEYIINLFAADKIRDLIKGCNMAGIMDGYFSEKCMQLCKNFLHKIQEKEIDLSDSRTIRLADTLFMIHEYMTKNEKGLDFLEYFLFQNHK